MQKAIFLYATYSVCRVFNIIIVYWTIRMLKKFGQRPGVFESYTTVNKFWQYYRTYTGEKPFSF